jgi:hypothetical protein
MVAQYAGQAFPIPDDSSEDDKEKLSRLRVISDEDILIRGL